MSTTAAPRSASGIAFLVAGGAILLAIVSFVTAFLPANDWLYLVAFVAITVGLVLLALRDLHNGTARTAALFAALGWAILVVARLVPGLPGLVDSSAQLVILVASVVVAIVVGVVKDLPQRSRFALIASSAIAALYMLSALFGWFGSLAALTTILLGVTLLVHGYFRTTHQ